MLYCQFLAPLLCFCVMAYVPPHMRQNKGELAPTLPPESMIPRSHRNPDVSSEKKAFQAGNAILKWFVVGLADESRVSSSTHLEPVDLESFERKNGEKPLVLVLNDENGEPLQENPWSYVVEAVKQDLFASFEQVKNETRNFEFEETRPTLVLRLGRVIFKGSRPFFTTESLKGSSLPVSTLNQVRKSFNAEVPPPHMEYIASTVVPQIVSDSDHKEMELYHVRLSDNKRPDLTISCECTFVKEKNQLEYSKIELNQVRLMTVDMSCLGKDMDLRLMLSNKRVVVELTEEEREGIESLVSSAVLDSDANGGLTWPSGKQSACGRFTVVGVMHTKVKTYCINSSTRLRLRHFDRFDYLTSTGEADNEVVLKLHGIVSQLQEDEVNTEFVLEMLEDNLKLIWKHFLSCV